MDEAADTIEELVEALRTAKRVLDHEGIPCTQIERALAKLEGDA
jgi:hypothetical protein